MLLGEFCSDQAFTVCTKHSLRSCWESKQNEKGFLHIPSGMPSFLKHSLKMEE